MVADRSDDADSGLVVINGTDIVVARDVHGDVIRLITVIDLTGQIGHFTGSFGHERSPVPLLLFFIEAADIDNVTFNPGEGLVVRIFSSGGTLIRESGFQGDLVGVPIVLGSDGSFDFLVAGDGENAGEGKDAIE